MRRRKLLEARFVTLLYRKFGLSLPPRLRRLVLVADKLAGFLNLLHQTAGLSCYFINKSPISSETEEAIQ